MLISAHKAVSVGKIQVEAFMRPMNLTQAALILARMCRNSPDF